MNQNSLKKIFGVAAALLFALAVALLIIALAVIETTATKVVMLIAAVLSFVMAALLGYLMLLALDSNANYFLYDTKTKRNIPVKSLTFEVVNIKMNRYLSNYAKSVGKLWTDRILEAPETDIAPIFKPLVAYKLLFDLAAHDAENGWKCFEYASYETVDFICGALEMNGDREMGEALRQMKSGLNVRCDIKAVRDYLVSNCPYLKDRMLRYVRDNIEKFQ